MASPSPVAARPPRAFAVSRAHPVSVRPRHVGFGLVPGKCQARHARFSARARRSRIAVAKADGSFWDIGEDDPPMHRGYTPVPGFGEFYVPPAPPKPETLKGKQGEAQMGPPAQARPRPRSKLLEEPVTAGMWAPPGNAPRAARGSEHAHAHARSKSFGDELRAVRGESPDGAAGSSSSNVPALATATRGTTQTGLVAYDASSGMGYSSNGHENGVDPELSRLRATYKFLIKMIGWLRFLFPVTGGLACWVAASASLGGIFAKLIPNMVNAVNVFAFALAAVMGTSLCLGIILVVALVGRVLRNMLFEDWDSAGYEPPPPPFDYPTHPGLLAAARAQSEQELMYRTQQMQRARQYEQQYEEYDRQYSDRAERNDARSRARAAREERPPPLSAASRRAAAGSWDESDRHVSPGSSYDGSYADLSYAEEEEMVDAYAAKTPPKRERVDLPIETLMGLGGETLDAVGSEWCAQRRREAGVEREEAAAMNETKPQNEGGRNQRQTLRSDGAYVARSRPQAQPPPPPPPPPSAPAPATRVGEVDWNPDSLLNDMGYGESVRAASAPNASRGKQNGGWFGGLFGGGGDGDGARDQPRGSLPSPSPPPRPPAVSSAPDIDPVMAMLGGGARPNPNAARAAAAAANPPSGEYYLTPPQQSREQFEEMRRRRDEWNKRVRRAVKRKEEDDE